jgi:hypothetical protein
LVWFAGIRQGTFFAEHGMIQISDFSDNNMFNQEGDERIETDFEDFSRANFTPSANMQVFAQIRSEI